MPTTRSSMPVENRLELTAPHNLRSNPKPRDPRKVIFGTTTNIHSTGILIVLDGKKYLTLTKYP